MKTALLILDERANTDEMVRLYLELNKSMREKYKGGKGLTVIVNDKAIEGRELELEEKANIIFFRDWKNDIRYRHLIRQTLEDTEDIYIMNQVEDKWELKKAEEKDYQILDPDGKINIKPIL